MSARRGSVSLFQPPVPVPRNQVIIEEPVKSEEKHCGIKSLTKSVELLKQDVVEIHKAPCKCQKDVDVLKKEVSLLQSLVKDIIEN